MTFVRNEEENNVNNSLFYIYNSALVTGVIDNEGSSKHIGNQQSQTLETQYQPPPLPSNCDNCKTADLDCLSCRTPFQ